MTKPKVLISDKMDPNAERILKELGCEVESRGGRYLLLGHRFTSVGTTRHRA